MNQLPTAAIEAPTTRRRSVLLISHGHLFVFSFVLLATYGDRGFYEQDALELIAGGINLPAGRTGDFSLYNFAHQPLTHALYFWVFNLTGSVTALYLLPAMFGALTICLYAAFIYRITHSLVFVGAGLIVVASQQEVIMTMLYPNSSVYGMCMFLFAVFLSRPRNGESGLRPMSVVLVAEVFAASVLFRFDFALGAPFLLWRIAGFPDRRISNGLIFVLGVCGTLFFAWVVGLFPFAELWEIIRIQGQYADRLQDWRWRLNMLLSSMPLPMMALLAIYGVYLLWQAARFRTVGTVITGLTILLLLYGIRDLTSPKYLLPFLVLAPIFHLQFVEHLRSLHRPLAAGALAVFLCAISLFHLFMAIELTSKTPFVRVTSSPRAVYTHDNMRQYGKYLSVYRSVRQSNKPMDPYLRSAFMRRVVQLVESEEIDFLFITKEAPGASWLFKAFYQLLPLYFIEQGYEFKIEQGWHPRRYLFSRGTQRVYVREPSEYQFDGIDRDDVAAGRMRIVEPGEYPGGKPNVLFNKSLEHSISPISKDYPTLINVAVEATPSGRISSRGWVVSPHSVASVEIWDDAARIATARYPLSRGDVYRSFPQYRDVMPGFDSVVEIDTQSMPAHVKIRAIDAAGQILAEETRAITVVKP